jgi:beta-aspartyl-dipeptidase (metallo-type)
VTTGIKKDDSEREEKSLAKLFLGGELYCPDYQGQGDVLVVGGMIARIAKKIAAPKDFLDLQIIDATDRILTPGIIDQHCHLIGAGGAAGPVSRTREIKIQQIIQAGVTTIVGCLGFDNITRDLKRLLVKAIALDQQGITTFIYTGSYLMPPATITGSVESDLALIDKVVGIKLGMAEVSSTHPDEREVKGLIVAGNRGALLSGKAGIVHIHLGDVPGDWFKMAEEILHETTIPFTRLIFTHANRSSQVFDGALEFAKKGGFVDMTAVINPDLLPPNFLEESKAKGLRKPSKAIEEMLNKGVPEGNLTLSSDSNASGMSPDGQLRYGSINTLYKEFRDLAMSTNDIPLALKMVTLNPAKRLGIIRRKGSLGEGKDADILVLTKDLQIQEVYARGKVMAKDGRPVVKDPFE